MLQVRKGDPVVPIVTVTATIQVDTDEAGIDVYELEANPTEDNVEDLVYRYFEKHPDELADLIKQQCAEEKNYQDTVEVAFEEWG